MISGITDGLKKINEMEIGGLIAEMRELLKNANAKISELDLKKVSENLTDITQDLKDFTGDEKLAGLLDNLDVTIKEMRSLSEKANKNIDPLLKDIGELAENTRQSLIKINATAEELSKVTDPRSPLLMQFKNLLNDAEQASQQLQEMVNDLKRNPNSLIRGKESE
jgi:methyl-accepting chemotaxis protein